MYYGKENHLCSLLSGHQPSKRYSHKFNVSQSLSLGARGCQDVILCYNGMDLKKKTTCM